MTLYRDFFRLATGNAPYPYQERVGVGAPAVLYVGTGLGKTEATVLGWVYRLIQEPGHTPRRLVYCLPMRSLVEQTRDRIRACFLRLESAGITTPSIDVVMGGDVADAWMRNPERPYVVIGTQDMLLSRALNRGYAMNRFNWPMAFGALHDDVYWVMDEVQLQGIGAITSTQLHAFRERFGTFHRTDLTLTSATIDEDWFKTADFSLDGRLGIELSEDDFADARVQRIVGAQKRIERSTVFEPKHVAALARERHQTGTRTLIVVNRVARAQEIYGHLKGARGDAELVLLHSRYRAEDRAAHARALTDDIDATGPGRIVVATQVVEAGVDVSAATLITDIAPWSSLVQRFGRCNRRGTDTDAVCLWLDAGTAKKGDARPYEAADVSDARRLLLDLEGLSGAPRDLPTSSIPLRTGLVIRRPEFLDLFDTSPDLSGHDVDVSPYIREADDVSVSLFWRPEPPDARDVPRREELCAAPVSSVRDLLKGLRASGHGGDIRVGNQFARDSERSWTDLHESELRPGQIIWLRSDVGWYDRELGFAKVSALVPAIEREIASHLSEDCPASDSDTLSEIGIAIPLTRHALDTQRHASVLCEAVVLDQSAATMVQTAARYHDAGKAHDVFQDTMRRANEANTGETTIWAKGVRRVRHRRRGFRHELPGALAYLQSHDGEFTADAIAYLIAAHHGKLRVAAQQYPSEASVEPFQFLGVVDGEQLPDVDLGDGMILPRTTLLLNSFRVGSLDGTRSWIDRTIGLRDDPSIGPFRLAYMELLVRIADWRASEEEKRCP